MPKSKVIFIAGTDTGVGKTIAVFVLGVLLEAKGRDIGVMKPVQCAGNDAAFLKKSLDLEDDLAVINPFYAPEPLSPHLAFLRAGIKFDKSLVLGLLRKLQKSHEIILVEGAGGLMVPLTDHYYNLDLIVDLKAEMIIVARLGLGTINHTLLTINQARQRGLAVKGIIFCQTAPQKEGLPESTNPHEIERLSGVKVLGIIPYLKSLTRKNILRRCQNFKQIV